MLKIFFGKSPLRLDRLPVYVALNSASSSLEMSVISFTLSVMCSKLSRPVLESRLSPVLSFIWAFAGVCSQFQSQWLVSRVPLLGRSAIHFQCFNHQCPFFHHCYYLLFTTVSFFFPLFYFIITDNVFRYLDIFFDGPRRCPCLLSQCFITIFLLALFYY